MRGRPGPVAQVLGPTALYLLALTVLDRPGARALRRQPRLVFAADLDAFGREVAAQGGPAMVRRAAGYDAGLILVLNGSAWLALRPAAGHTTHWRSVLRWAPAAAAVADLAENRQLLATLATAAAPSEPEGPTDPGLRRLRRLGRVKFALYGAEVVAVLVAALGIGSVGQPANRRPVSAS